MTPFSMSLALGAVLLCGAARAQGGHAPPGSDPAPPRPARSAEALARFPQPVRVGSLLGRQVIENTIRQRVLGRVAGVLRGEDGEPALLVERGGWFGSARPVAVPAKAMALLGDLVVLHDLDPAALAALPGADRDGDRLPPDAVIRVGLARN